MEIWTIQAKIGDRWEVKVWAFTEKALLDKIKFNPPRFAFRTVPMVVDESRAKYYEGTN